MTKRLPQSAAAWAAEQGTETHYLCMLPLSCTWPIMVLSTHMHHESLELTPSRRKYCSLFCERGRDTESEHVTEYS